MEASKAKVDYADLQEHGYQTLSKEKHSTIDIILEKIMSRYNFYHLITEFTKFRTPFEVDLKELKIHAIHEISDEGIEFLCQNIAHNTTLRSLSLMNNNIGNNMCTLRMHFDVE
jgi:hypothetical protein